MSPPSGKKPIIDAYVSKEKDLYIKLVRNARSPTDSIQVVAFLMWLQTLIVTDVADLLIGKMMKHPIKVIDAIAGEIMDCLNCVQSQIMPFTKGIYDISLLRAFVTKTAKMDITLDHLYQNRRVVIKGVRKMVRAFNGIYEEQDESSTASCSTACSTTASPQTLANPDGSRASKGKAMVKSTDVVEHSANPPTKPKVERVVVKRYLPYGHYRCEEEDDRTVLLTFSKGYQIPAPEVASFFNRKLGRHVVDKIYMKNVKKNKEVMYARMVCIEPAAANTIVDPRDGIIAKYFIRGRQVLAKKYVKKYRSASV